MTKVIAQTLLLLLLVATVRRVQAQVPQLINYQGRIAVGTVNFDGAGQFKFALVNGNGTITYWSNDGTSVAGSEPAAGVFLTVSKGLYSVLLGDATLPNMTAIPANVFDNPDVLLRVWFNDGTNGSQLLTPDHRLAVAPAGHVRNAATTTPDAWQQRVSGAPPAARSLHTAVWTGSEMIIWGGYQFSYLNTGGRYNPAGNSWTAVSTAGAPSVRHGHTAAWTGSDMIVWGGYGGGSTLNTGGRYHPEDNTWTTMSTTHAPVARYLHTAVWTGSEMIVWGGVNYDGIFLYFNDGGRYNPLGNSWTAMTTTGAPAARSVHTAVWTGSEMIIWGGDAGNGRVLNAGARYNPAGNAWTAVSLNGAPVARYDHTAIWTGSEMIIWGGYSDSTGSLNTGGRYNLTANSWTAVSTTGAPAGRANHRAVWTGSEMIIWGGAYVGSNGSRVGLDTGGRYNPAGNNWAAVSTTAAPAARAGHTAVWTGGEMIVWGGSPFFYNYLNDGGRYNPAANSWTAVSIIIPPPARTYHTAVWTGAEMIVWGGYDGAGFGSYLNNGGRYNPAGNSWTMMSTTGAPTGRLFHTAVWMGSEMIVWGGANDVSYFNDGARYNPGSDSWASVSATGAPAARSSHTAVWTGSEMIVWGGYNDSRGSLNTGGRYQPAGNSWTAMNAAGAPAPRNTHTAVWTGSEMIVWGGFDSSAMNDGGCYNPSANNWAAMSTTAAPGARSLHTAVWTGSEMVVWGGYGGSSALSDGGRYDPASNSWSAVNNAGAPAARSAHTSVWTGSEMILWGGYGDNYLNDGGRYNPAGNNWTPVTTSGAPSARSGHTAVWTGKEMFVWGGYNGISNFNDTFSYTPDCSIFGITSVFLKGGNLTLSFPTVRGRTYSLWHSGTLTIGSWTNTGLPALAGTGATLNFSIPDTAAARGFFRVQAGP